MNINLTNFIAGFYLPLQCCYCTVSYWDVMPCTFAQHSSGKNDSWLIFEIVKECRGSVSVLTSSSRILSSLHGQKQKSSRSQGENVHELTSPALSFADFRCPGEREINFRRSCCDSPPRSVLDSDPSATQSSAHRQKSLGESTTSSIKFSYTTQCVLLLTAAAATPSVLPQLVRHTLSEEGAAEVQLRQVSQMSSQTTLLRKSVWKG